MSGQPVHFRDAGPADYNFILSSWLRSYRESSFAKDMPNPVYFEHHAMAIERSFGRSRVICAVNPEDPEHIYGWICLEQSGEYTVLHYMYVKQAFRIFGIGRELFGFVKKRPFVYTHRTPIFDKFKDGGIYSVYHFLEGRT